MLVLNFLKKVFLNLTINMQLLYFITTVISQVHSARHHQHAGYSALPSNTQGLIKKPAIDSDSIFEIYSPSHFEVLISITEITPLMMKT